MRPSPEAIDILTAPQRKEILLLQQDGFITPQTSVRTRTYNTLEGMGIVDVYAISPEGRTFQLSAVWRYVTIPKDGIDLCVPAEEVKEKSFLRGLTPDPPRKPLVRPPAEYSNCLTGEALIDQILGRKTKTRYGK